MAPPSSVIAGRDVPVAPDCLLSVAGITERIRAWYDRSSTLRNVLAIASGAMVGRAMVFAAAPVISRIYSPDDFGLLATFAAFLALLVAAASLRYEWAIPLAQDQSEARNLLVLGASLVVAIGLVTGMVVLLAGPQIADLVGAPDVAPYLWLLPLGILGGGLYKLLNFWAVRAEEYQAIGRTRVTRGFGQITTQIAVGAAGITPGGLMVGYLVGQTWGVGTLGRLTLRNSTAKWRGVTWGSLKRSAGRHRKFPIFALPASILNVGATSLPALFMVAIYSPKVAGFLFFALRTMRVPFELIARAVGQVYHGEVSKIARTKGAGVSSLLGRFTTRLLLVGAAPAALLIFAGPALFEFVFGQEWRVAGQYARFLAPSFLAQFVVVPVSQTANTLGSQRAQLVVDLFRMLALAGVFVFAAVVTISPGVTVLAYSLTAVVAYLAFAALYWTVARRWDGATDG